MRGVGVKKLWTEGGGGVAAIVTAGEGVKIAVAISAEK